MVSEVHLKFPKFTTNLAISLHSCHSNSELRNKVMNFTPNFVGSYKVFRAKFASFSVVGLVIQLHNTNEFKLSGNTSQPSKAYFMMFTSEM